MANEAEERRAGWRRRGSGGSLLAPAGTIADLAGSDAIQPVHLAAAIQYRPRRQN